MPGRARHLSDSDRKISGAFTLKQREPTNPFERMNRNRVRLIGPLAYLRRPISLPQSNILSANSENNFTSAGNQFIFNRPADQTGWWLQSQTNTVSGTHRLNAGNSLQTNQMTFLLNTDSGTVFFRLVSP